MFWLIDVLVDRCFGWSMFWLIVVYVLHDSKYSTTRVLFASTYTAKQLKTIYYSLNQSFVFNYSAVASSSGFRWMRWKSQCHSSKRNYRNPKQSKFKMVFPIFSSQGDVIKAVVDTQFVDNDILPICRYGWCIGDKNFEKKPKNIARFMCNFTAFGHSKYI